MFIISPSLSPLPLEADATFRKFVGCWSKGSTLSTCLSVCIQKRFNALPRMFKLSLKKEDSLVSSHQTIKFLQPLHLNQNFTFPAHHFIINGMRILRSSACREWQRCLEHNFSMLCRLGFVLFSDFLKYRKSDFWKLLSLQGNIAVIGLDLFGAIFIFNPNNPA